MRDRNSMRDHIHNENIYIASEDYFPKRPFHWLPASLGLLKPSIPNLTNLKVDKILKIVVQIFKKS